MSTFQDTYARVIDNMAGVAGTTESIQYLGSVERAIDQCIEVLKQEAQHRKNVDVNLHC